jgi:hypothetical protein
VQSGLDRARTGAELCGGLGLGQALEVEQGDRLALPGWECGDRGSHPDCQLIRGDQLDGIRIDARLWQPPVLAQQVK